MVNEIKKIAGKTIINEKLLGTGENAIKLQPSSEASGNNSVAEGNGTIASGSASHAEGGFNTTASGDCSHAEGVATTASGDSSHAEGDSATASGYSSHAEGSFSIAEGDSSHAEGYNTEALGYVSHAEGGWTIASGTYSHAEGYHTTASGTHQHVQGKYNIEDTNNKYAHIVGNGQFNPETEIEEYSNAHTLDWEGNAWFAGNIRIGGTSYEDGEEIKGEKGLSAYEVAVQKGYIGTEEEWLQSLRGVSGVYVGAGDMPEGYNVQIDPSGTTVEYAKKTEVNSKISTLESDISELKGDLEDVILETKRGYISPIKVIYSATMATSSGNIYLYNNNSTDIGVYMLSSGVEYDIKCQTGENTNRITGYASSLELYSGEQVSGTTLLGAVIDKYEGELNTTYNLKYTPAQDCYLYVQEKKSDTDFSFQNAVIGDFKVPVTDNITEELNNLKEKVDVSFNEVNEHFSDYDDSIFADSKEIMTPISEYVGRSIYIVGTTFFQSLQNDVYVILGYKIRKGVTYDIYNSAAFGVSARNTLLVVTENEIPEPSGNNGTATNVVYYKNVESEEAITHTEYTATIDGYLYVQKITSNSYTQGVIESVKIQKYKKAFPLYGKKIAFFGDSIFGNFRDSNLDNISIPSMVSDRTNAICYNFGFGGCRMAEHEVDIWDAFCMHSLSDSIESGDWSVQDTAIANGTANHLYYFSETLNQLKSVDWNEMDIIVIGYGTNDFSGNVTEVNFKNALSHSIEKLLSSYPHLKILVVSPMWRFYAKESPYIDSDSKINNNGNKLTDFVDWCKSEADLNHIPYIDTYTNLGINQFNRFQYFNTNDGTHPNINGRRLRANLISAELLRSCT